MSAIDRQKVIERCIQELRRMQHIIVDGRAYYRWAWSWREYTSDEKLDILKSKIPMLLKEFERL